MSFSEIRYPKTIENPEWFEEFETDEVVEKLRKFKPTVIERANKWINIPLIPESVEAFVLDLVYDAILLALTELRNKNKE